MNEKEFNTRMTEVKCLIDKLEYNKTVHSDFRYNELLSIIKELFILAKVENERYFELENEYAKYGTPDFNIKRILNLKK